MLSGAETDDGRPLTGYQPALQKRYNTKNLVIVWHKKSQTMRRLKDKR